MDSRSVYSSAGPSLEKEIPKRIYENLVKGKTTTAERVLVTSNVTLKSFKLSDEDVELVKSAAAKKYAKTSMTALEYSTILATKWLHITFGCTSLDKLTGGGILLRGVTEIYGESGCGKSQLCLQLALNVQLPIAQGGLNKAAVFICTEDAFPSKRLLQLAQHYTKLHHQTEWLDNIYIEHIDTSEKLLNCVLKRLPTLMNQHAIGVIVIDSIAGVFRFETNAIARANDMRKLVLGLQLLSDEHECAVVCINQVTAVINNRLSKMNDLIPCLGLAWSNLVTSRLMIRKTNKCAPGQPKSNELTKQNGSIQVRDVELVFSPEMPHGHAEFIITENGISDVH